MWACQNGHKEAAELLLERGAQVDLQDIDGWSSLMCASDKGQTEVVKLLLERGAQVDLQDNDGWSSLMYTIQTEVVELLLERGAQMDLRNNDGRTALELNDVYGYFGIVELLQMKSTQTTTNLCGTSNLYGEFFTLYYVLQSYGCPSHVHVVMETFR